MKKNTRLMRTSIQNIQPRYDELELAERVEEAIRSAYKAPEFCELSIEDWSLKQWRVLKLAIEEALQATEYATTGQVRSFRWSLDAADKQLTPAQKNVILSLYEDARNIQQSRYKTNIPFATYKVLVRDGYVSTDNCLTEFGGKIAEALFERDIGA